MASRSAARRAWRVARGKIDPRCDYCGIVTSEHVAETDPQRATVEDIMPLSKGGKNNRSNWALACCACNQAKGTEEHWPNRVVPLPPCCGELNWARAKARRVAQITAKSRAQDRERIEEVERLALLARLPFTLYTPIPGVQDEAFR